MKPLKACLSLLSSKLIFSSLMLLIFGNITGCAFFGWTETPEPSIKSAKVLKTAQKQMGRPYRYAGSSPKTGFDCSGLVYWSFAQHGVKVPRRTKELLLHGYRIGIKELAPGDLVFFDLAKRSLFRPSRLHVGLYTGNGRFIHSPSSGGRIREDRMSVPPWKECFIGARRI